ncbi:MAG: S9 family peptidase [Bacteroidota bacterium]
MKNTTLFFLLFFTIETSLTAQPPLSPEDIFNLEYTSDPQISPDGKTIVYTRQSMDIMKDRVLGGIWQISYDNTYHRPLTSATHPEGQARWSPSGNRILYTVRKDGASYLFVKWMDTGQEVPLSRLDRSPSNLSWSPDGNWIAYTAFVEKESSPYISMPAKPKGAEWAQPAKYIDAVRYRNDGGGYVKAGHRQIFLLSAEGGTPRQLTDSPYHHQGPLNWTKDGKSLVYSANPHDEGAYQPRNSEILSLNIASRESKQLTQRKGPDYLPRLSPDGKQIAYLGYEDRYQGYQLTYLHLMNADGTASKILTKDLDRSIENFQWAQDGSGIFIQYSDEGMGKIGFLTLQNGKMEPVADNVGGTSLGRPYSSGSFSVGANGAFAYTINSPRSPADVAVGKLGTKPITQLTHVNEDLLGFKSLGEVEEIWYESAFDQRKIQGWIVKPPQFDASKKYPLILEIHGGPFANYGYRFSAEMQLYAAAGYVVLYTNPRGSTSYGEAFGNLIHHNYPSEDYDDLMSGVDAVLEKGYVDENQLYVTGGSGGGVLSSWIIGKTDRFQAAVVAKPVINWYSWALTADGYTGYYQYWFPGKPWEHQDHYMKRSPISLIGNVTTPTMLLTGEVDYRTPISETEQYYQALKLQKVESAMVRIPEASHGIAARPSYLISKVLHVLKWFDEH